MSDISKKTSKVEHPWSIFYIIYILTYNNAYIVENAQYMKTCIFVLLVDEYYIIINLELSSIVHNTYYII